LKRYSTQTTLICGRRLPDYYFQVLFFMDAIDFLWNGVVSGSKVNRALTNYSLSTWLAYDTRYFAAKAFTATLSGPALTGGTD